MTSNPPLYQGNAAVALNMADAFFKNASVFLDSAPKDLNATGRYAAEHFGELLTSAVELHFAAELYIKAVLILSGIKVPKDHRLTALFGLLPNQIRDSVQMAYDKRRPEKRGMQEILMVCDKGFETWRYIYEKGTPGKKEIFDFPAEGLRIINRGLHDVAYGKKSPK
jgi:HEPN domain-containing protein